MIPPFLKRGDTVGICATARWLTPEQLESAIAVIEGWGFRVRVQEQVTTRTGQLAGSDNVRKQALQELLDEDEVKAILIARGGYGTVRVLDGLDWTGFLRNPKWIGGYSDITVLHAELNRLGVASIHSTMPVSFGDCTPRAVDSLRAALMGEYPWWEWAIESQESVELSGELVGGNLSVLFSLLGSYSFPDLRGRILFVEDVDEMHYHIDRMWMALKRGGVLNGLRGVLAGGFTQMKDNTRAFGFASDNPWGADAFETMTEHCRHAGIPLVSGMPAGHFNDNCAFILGVEAELKCRGASATLSYPKHR